jgi:hypothetical protein
MLPHDTTQRCTVPLYRLNCQNFNGYLYIIFKQSSMFACGDSPRVATWKQFTFQQITFYVQSCLTRQYNPEDSSEHHTRRRENLKSQITFCFRSLAFEACDLWPAQCRGQGNQAERLCLCGPLPHQMEARLPWRSLCQRNLCMPKMILTFRQAAEDLQWICCKTYFVYKKPLKDRKCLITFSNLQLSQKKQ